MSHPSVGTLRAYRDAELPPARRAAVERHVAACARCGAALAEVEDDAGWAEAAIAADAAAPEPALDGSVPAGVAWRRLAEVYGRAAGDGAPGAGARGGAPQVGPTAPPPPVWQRWSPLRLATAGGVLVALLALSLQPVRAAVSNAFSVFQVHQVRVVTVSPAEVTQIRAQLRSALASGAGRVDLKGLASISVAPAGARPAAVSLAAARQLVPFPLEVATPPPAGYRLASVRVQPRTTVTLTPHVAGFNRLLASLGSTDRLPPSLNGQSIRIEERAAALLTYAPAAPAAPTAPSPAAGPAGSPAAPGSAPSGGGPQSIRVVEAASPIVRVPQGVNVAAVRQAVLALPFLPPNVERQLAAISDWQQTAVVPAVAGRNQTVTVGGAQGLFTPASRPGRPGVLVWFSGGVVRAVAGQLTQAQALAVADSLH